jgi:hypothetical protein
MQAAISAYFMSMHLLVCYISGTKELKWCIWKNSALVTYRTKLQCKWVCEIMSLTIPITNACEQEVMLL